MKPKLIAALSIAMLLLIAVGSTALADTAYCDTCGKFTSFTPIGWEVVKKDPIYHRRIYECDVCKNEIGSGSDPHTGGTATCVKKAVCEKCGADYGSLSSFHITELHEGKTPTCTEGGWDAYFVCRDCGYSTKKEIGPLEHDYGPWILNNNGTHTRVCNRDNSHKETEKCSGGTASCTTKAVCAKCGAQYGSTSDHDLTHHEAKAATCTEKGWKAYDTCSRCDYTTYVEISALGHDEVHHEAKAATCTDKGWKAYDTCSRCDYTTYAEISALGHDEVHHDAKVATCTDKGWKAYDTCSRCEYTTYAEIPALGHDEVHHEAKAATCTEKGWKVYDTCSRCKYTTYAEIPALGHDEVHHEAKATTCTEKGWKAYDTCSRCKYTTYAEIPATGHDLTHHEAKAATCTEKGWKAYDTCSRCEYTTYAEIPAAGHDLVHHEAKAATCTEIGWDVYDACSRYDYTTYVELPALGHDYQDEIVPRTCKEEGYTLHTCSRCKDHYADNIMPPYGHWYGEWTGNGDGTQRAECQRSGCYSKKTVDCESIELPGLNVSICPVCGTVNDGSKLAMTNASVKIINGKTPYGEAILRLGTLASGEKLLTVGYVYGGQLSKASCQVKITLPAELVNGCTLSLLNADGTETAVAYTVEGGSAVFTLDFVQSQHDALLLRLIPVA